MPRRGERKKRPPLGDLSDPQSLASLHAAFLEHSRVRGYREGTVVNRDRYGRAFILWCQERGILRASEVTRPILERYQRHLYHYRRANGEPLSFQTQYAHLSPLKMFFRWLARERHIVHNPASELELPRLDRRLPKHVLTAQEAEQVLVQPDLASPVGLRDRAILETLYSCGLRRMELIRLQLWDIDRERGTVLVRQSKGRRDRLVPIGARADFSLDQEAEAREIVLCLVLVGRAVRGRSSAYIGRWLSGRTCVEPSGPCCETVGEGRGPRGARTECRLVGGES